MEDVLDVYMRPYDRRRPVVCLDETSVQLVAESRTPLPMAPGQPARYDYEYERNGVANLFMITEPLRGWREVVVGDHRTAIDVERGVIVLGMKRNGQVRRDGPRRGRPDQYRDVAAAKRRDLSSDIFGAFSA